MLRKIAGYSLVTYAALVAMLLIDSNLIGVKVFGGQVGMLIFWFLAFFAWTVPLVVAVNCVVADWFRIKAASK